MDQLSQIARLFKRAHCEITDFGEYSDGGLRQGLNLPGDLLQDYYADHDFGEDVVGGEVEDELHGEEEEGVAEEGLRKGLALPDNLLEDYYALETEVSTDLTVSTEVDFSTGLDWHFESSTEEKDEDKEEDDEEERKSTSGGKSFTGNPSTTLQPSHNGHWKGEGKAKGKRVRGKAKSGSGEEELLRQEVEDEQVEGTGAVLVLNL